MKAYIHYEGFVRIDELPVPANVGATDKPCGVRTVANPKLLLNGT